MKESERDSRSSRNCYSAGRCLPLFSGAARARVQILQHKSHIVRVKAMARKIAVFVVLFSGLMSAQEAAKPPEYGWKKTLVSGLNLTQVSLHNWVQGGENTLAWTFLTTGKFVYDQETYAWTNNLKLTYGQTKVGSREFEKTDDELFFESMAAYNLGWKANPYFAASARTQLAPGYKMIRDESAQTDIKTQTSGFFDPGYLMQSAGFTYQPSEIFGMRLGIAVKETFASKYAAYGYTGDPGKKVRVQTGIEFGSNLKYQVMENILFTSQLNTFSAFEKLDVWDVRWDNSLTAKVNAYVNVSLNVLIVHEIAQTRRTQLKQILALGLSYTLF